MPLTDLQIEIFRILAANRSEQSFIAGAAVIHSTEASPRFSQDIDFFHDTEEQVGISAERDGIALVNQGYTVEWKRSFSPATRRALVSKENQSTLLEWVWDSAWRFFPLQRDELMGWRLHLADVATNKVIAAAERGEARDFLDLLYLHGTFLHLAGLIWAACGKNPGYTPELLLRQCNWRARFHPSDLEMIQTTQELRPEELKEEWLKAALDAEEYLREPAGIEPGSLYLSSDCAPKLPSSFSEEATAGLIRHEPSLGGAWPRIPPA